MSKLDNILNNIYCLTQGASSTIINLRAYPHIIKNPNSHRLFTLFKELHSNTLEAYKYIQLESHDKNLEIHLSKLYNKGTTIEETYGLFISTVSLPPDHILIKKLRLQVNNIQLTLLKLEKILSMLEL